MLRLATSSTCAWEYPAQCPAARSHHESDMPSVIRAHRSANARSTGNAAPGARPPPP